MRARYHSTVLVKVLCGVHAHAELTEFNNTDQAPAELIDY